MRANIKIKKTTKRFKKLKIFAVLLIALVVAFGYWLPQYIILAEGTQLTLRPTNFYSCLLNSDASDSSKIPIEIGSPIAIVSNILPDAVISDFSPQEFIILSNHQNTSLTITLDDDDGGAFWLKFEVEQDLGNNPFYKIFENWKRKNREKAISLFLRDFKSNRLAKCKNIK